MNNMLCPKCGIQIDDESGTCPECGAEIQIKTQTALNPETYTCDGCEEELEYITTYKQWYCYNCQTYLDLPPPGEEEVGPVQKERIDSVQDEFDKDLETRVEDAMDREKTKEEGTEVSDEVEVEFESETAFSWDDGVSESADEEQEEPSRDIDSGEDFEPEPEEEIDLSWDEDEGTEKENDEDELNFEIEGDAEIDFEVYAEDELDLEEEPKEGSNKILEPELESDYEQLEEFEPESDFDESIPVEYEDIENEEKDESIELGESTIEEDSEAELELEFYEEELMEGEYIQDLNEDVTVTGDENERSLKEKALTKLHLAWVRVNKLKKLNPNEPRILDLETELQEALKGEFDPMDGIILADESLEDAEKLEKELKESIHNNVDNLFHFVNSKIILARRIGFDVMELEDKLDDASSTIARGDYLEAKDNLQSCLSTIYELPKTQEDVLVTLEDRAEIIQELLEPLEVDGIQNV